MTRQPALLPRLTRSRCNFSHPGPEPTGPGWLFLLYLATRFCSPSLPKVTKMRVSGVKLGAVGSRGPQTRFCGIGSGATNTCGPKIVAWISPQAAFVCDNSRRAKTRPANQAAKRAMSQDQRQWATRKNRLSEFPEPFIVDAEISPSSAIVQSEGGSTEATRMLLPAG